MTDDMRRPPADGELESVLRALARAVDWPSAGGPPVGPDLATRVAARLRAGSTGPAAPVGRRSRRWSDWLPRRSPARRALLLALVALLALAAVAAAVRLGVPGIGIEFGRPSATPDAARPSASGAPSGSGAPGGDLGLGTPIPVDEVEARSGLPLRLPAVEVVGGPPDAAYRSEAGIVSLVWAPSRALPATREPEVGLLLTVLDGRIGPDVVRKLAATGTHVEPLTIDGRTGYWLSGEAHFFYVLDRAGRPIESTRRWVGDTLVWSDGELTYRVESALGRDRAVRVAESLE